MPCSPETPDDSWVRFPKDQGGTGEYCYYFDQWVQLGWIEANDDCIKKGGRLASIHSQEENTFLMHSFVSNGVGWIGFIKNSLLGQFEWTDGSSAEYLAWAPGGKCNTIINLQLHFCYQSV